MRKIGKITLWVFALFGGVVATALLAVIAFSATVRDRVPDLSDQAVLYLDLNEPIVERVTRQPLFDSELPPTLLEKIEAIRLAATTDQIKALAIGIGDPALSFAHAEELADAIDAFRASGKPSFAYARTLGGFGDSLPELMVASSVETVWLNPTGMVSLTGVALEVPYAAEGLERFGIDAEFEQRYEFKGGADPFTETRMPAPVRRSLTMLVQGLAGEAVRIIGRGRNMEDEQVESLMQEGLFIASEAKAVGLVDVIGYEDAFVEAVDEAVSPELDLDPEVEWVDVTLFLAIAAELVEENLLATGAVQSRIAVVYGVGAIGMGSDASAFSEPGFDVEGVIDTLNRIVDARRYDAVVFRVSSPGGAYGPSDLVWRAVHKVRDAGIPVVVSMADTAASGGYFVSVAADKIVALPTTITGSIGVYGGKFNTQGLWDEIGVRWERVEVGKNAGMFSSLRPFDDAERRRFAQSIDFVYEDFTSKVATDRWFSAAQIDAAARGRIFTGRQAQTLGLVDRLGGFSVAIEEALLLLHRSPGDAYQLSVLPEPKEAWEAIVEALEEGHFTLAIDHAISAGIARQVDGYIQAVLGDAATVLQPRGLVSLPPFVLRH